MKAKKFIALAMSVAMAVGTASLFAACNPDDNGDDGAYKEDTRLWYAVGRDTKGTLSKFDNFYPQDTSVAFTRDTTVTDENVFTLSLDIYAAPAGYGFKFLYKTSEDEVIDDTTLWTRQIGIHNFEGVEGEDKNAVIKNAAGEVVFTTKDGADANNLYLAKGQEGTYKFTLKTTSDTDSSPVITWEKTADIKVEYDMYLRGDINNFSTQNMTALTETIGSGSTHTTWSADFEITDNDLWRDGEGNEVNASSDPLIPDGTGEYAAIQVYNDIDGLTYITDEEDETFKTVTVKFSGKDYKSVLLPKGNYTVTFDAVDKTVSIVKHTHKMYFVGDFNENKTDANYLLTKNNDVWTGYLTIDADEADPEKETEVKLYNSIDDSETEAVNLKAGTYAFKFTQKDNAVAYEEVAYWLVGTFIDSRTSQNVNFAISEGITPKFEAAETAGEYKATVKADDMTGVKGYEWIAKDGGNTEKGVFAIQVVYGTALCGVKDWNSSGANQFLPAGVWEITFTAGKPVTWVEGDIANVPVPPALAFDMYLIGSFNSWEEGDADYSLNYNNGVWVGYLNVTADNTEVKLYNATTDSYFSTPALGEDNIVLNKGYYMFVFLEDGTEVKYDVVDFYLIGSFFNADGTQLSFDVSEGITPKFALTEDPNVYSVTYAVTDATSSALDHPYNFSTWGSGLDNPIFVWKPIATCSLAQYSGNYAGTKMWDLTPGSNNFLEAEGSYTFTYNVATKALNATLNTPAE